MRQRVKWGKDAWSNAWGDKSKGVGHKADEKGVNTDIDRGSNTVISGDSSSTNSTHMDIDTVDTDTSAAQHDDMKTTIPAERKEPERGNDPATPKKTDMKRTDLYESIPYEKTKIVREIEPRVTRAMSKAKNMDLYALWADKLKRDEEAMGPLEFAAHLTEIDKEIRAVNTESSMIDIVECLLSETYEDDEVQAYLSGIISNIPMHSTEAWLDELMCYRVSLKEAVAEKDPAKLQMFLSALDDEVDNLVIKMKAVIPVDARKLSIEERKARIPAHTFLKFKELANGDFERVKARTVAGGN